MSEPKDLAVVLSWLDKIETGGRVVWSDLQLSSEPVATGWVDVSVTSPCSPPWNWIWEILAPGSTPESDLTIFVDPDWIANGEPQWSAATLSHAIAAWIAERTGRTDIVVEMAPPGLPQSE